MRAALHDPDGLVVNVIVLDEDSDYEPTDGLTLLELDDDSPVGPGWLLVDDDWVEPDPPGPATPSLAELQAQLEQIQAQIQQLLEQQTPEPNPEED